MAFFFDGETEIILGDIFSVFDGANPGSHPVDVWVRTLEKTVHGRIQTV